MSPPALMKGILLCAAVGAAGVVMARKPAPDADTYNQLRAERLAVSVCATCHGAHGDSQQPKFPRLAGQNANYLAAQLRAFRAQTRGDPDAIGYMWGMAANLDDAVVDALAAYYARQIPARGQDGDTALIQRGGVEYAQGVAAEGVPPCAPCHGPTGHGIADYPRLAGQHSQYLLKQLGSFQNRLRDVAVMHGVTQGLRGPDMQAVAAYLQAQP